MTANLLSGRSSYKSSGAVNFALFLPWLFLAVVVAGLLAAFMFWLYHVGHYYIIIVPLLCGLAVAGMLRLAVAKGHCRNGLVAATAGLLLGAGLYLGSFYIGMVYHLGPETATQPKALYWYIRLRLATDVTRDTHSPRDESERGTPSPGMNWFRFGIESIGVIAIVTAAGYRGSRKPYCEHCHRWLTREVTTFEPGSEAAILESLRSGSSRWLATLFSAAPYPTIPSTMLAVEYCPTLKDGINHDCPVFLSVKTVTANPKGATLDTFGQSKGKLVAQTVHANANEIPALALRFPVFEISAGRAAVAALRPTEEEIEEQRKQFGGEFAEITPLSSDRFGKVLTKKMILIGNALAICVLLSFIGGLLLLAWGATILERVDKGTSDAKGAGIALCVIGGASVLSTLVGMFFDSSFGGNRILRKAFNAELARRSGVLVDANDPDAVFVEIVPKLNWGKMTLENASDVGLLLVDKARREIRFEGDKERWRVPAASITSCEVEKFVQTHGHGSTKIFYTVLRANRKSGFWEAPLRHRVGTGLFSGKRKKLANHLTAAIQEMRGTRQAAMI